MFMPVAKRNQRSEQNLSPVFAKALVFVLFIAQCIALCLNSWNTGPGWDEWWHLPSGLYTLQHGNYHPYCVNPPLARLIASVPVWLCGGAIEGAALQGYPTQRSEFGLATQYIAQHGASTFTWISIARTALIPLSLLGTYLIWSIGRRLYGTTSGVAAACLWSLSPSVLTFGATIAPDVTATVLGLLASYRCHIWLRIGTWKNALLLGGAIALAMLSKSTWILLPPVLIICCLLYAVQFNKHWNWKTRTRQAFMVLGSAWFAFNAGYEFQGTFTRLGEFRFCSKALCGTDTGNRNRFRGTWLEKIPVPFPADFVRGIDFQKRDFESKFESYFLGNWRDRGWLHYYLVGIALKEPIAIWVLATFAWGKALLFGRQRMSKTRASFQRIIMLPGISVLCFVSCQTGFNHHMRYVLPFLPCLYMLATRPLAALGKRSIAVCAVLIVCYGFSSAIHIPRSYSFFTEAIGGARQGCRYLGDSNLDWGQDLLTVKHWVADNPTKRPVYVIYSGPNPNLQDLGIDARYGDQFMSSRGPTRPGFWIVLATPMLKGNNRWFRKQTPVSELSVTTSVYRVRELNE